MVATNDTVCFDRDSRIQSVLAQPQNQPKCPKSQEEQGDLA